MPISVVLSSCRFDCLDCGHVHEFVAPLREVLKEAVIFDGTCLMCKSKNVVGCEVETPVTIPTEHERVAGVNPTLGVPTIKEGTPVPNPCSETCYRPTGHKGPHVGG